MLNEFKDYLIELNKELFSKEEGSADEILASFSSRANKPVDSVDRTLALFIADKHPELAPKDALNGFTEGPEVWYEKVDQGLRDINRYITNFAYNNYEREWLNEAEAFANLLKVVLDADGDRNYILKDSYYDNGWFGA